MKTTRPSLTRYHLTAAAAALLLAACSGEEPAAPKGDADPAFSAALGAQIMVDPDLVGQNTANNAATFGPDSGAVPAAEMGPQALEAARTEALAMLGGPGSLRKAPAARAVDGALPADATLTAAALAAASGKNNAACAGLAQYSASWAAGVPAAFPIYPRGAVQEAAGTDAQGCALRVVNYITPAPAGEVIDFYFTRAGQAGFSADRILQGGDDIVGGVKQASSYIVYTRPRAGGGTEVDLITNGK